MCRDFGRPSKHCLSRCWAKMCWQTPTEPGWQFKLCPCQATQLKIHQHDHVCIFGSSFADWFKICQFWQLLKTGARTLSLTRVLRNTEFAHSSQTGSFWNHGIHTVWNCTRPCWKLCVLVHTQTMSIFHTVLANATHKAAQPSARLQCNKALLMAYLVFESPAHHFEGVCSTMCITVTKAAAVYVERCMHIYTNLKSLTHTACSRLRACWDQGLSQSLRMSTEYQQRFTGLACNRVFYAPVTQHWMRWN